MLLLLPDTRHYVCSCTGHYSNPLVAEYFNILGYGRGGQWKYMVDEPTWWPQTVITFAKFEGPSYAKVDEIATILRSMLNHFELDPETHFHTDGFEASIIPKRKGVRKAKKSKKAKLTEDMSGMTDDR